MEKNTKLTKKDIKLIEENIKLIKAFLTTCMSDAEKKYIAQKVIIPHFLNLKEYWDLVVTVHLDPRFKKYERQVADDFEWQDMLKKYRKASSSLLMFCIDIKNVMNTQN